MKVCSKKQKKKALSLFNSHQNRWLSTKLWTNKEERLRRLFTKAYNKYCELKYNEQKTL